MSESKAPPRTPSARLSALFEALPDVPKPVVQLIEGYTGLTDSEKLNALLALAHGRHSSTDDDLCQWQCIAFVDGSRLRSGLRVRFSPVNALRATVSVLDQPLCDGTVVYALRLTKSGLPFWMNMDGDTLVLMAVLEQSTATVTATAGSLFSLLTDAMAPAAVTGTGSSAPTVPLTTLFEWPAPLCGVLGLWRCSLFEYESDSAPVKIR